MPFVECAVACGGGIQVGGCLLAIGDREHVLEERRTETTTLSCGLDTHEVQVPNGVVRMMFVQ